MAIAQAEKSRVGIPEGRYDVDPVHSSVGFAVLHNDISTFRGGFAEYDVRLEGGARPRLSGSVDVASIEIGEEQLKGHLLSPEFFDASHNQPLSFESNDVELGEDGSALVRGALEIGGLRRQVR